MSYRNSSFFLNKFRLSASGEFEGLFRFSSMEQEGWVPPSEDEMRGGYDSSALVRRSRDEWKILSPHDPYFVVAKWDDHPYWVGAKQLLPDVWEAERKRHAEIQAALLAEMEQKEKDTEALREELRQFCRDNNIPDWVYEAFATYRRKRSGPELDHDPRTFGPRLRQFVKNVDELDPEKLDEHSLCVCGRARRHQHLVEVSGKNDFFQGVDPNTVAGWIWSRAVEGSSVPADSTPPSNTSLGDLLKARFKK